MAKYVRLDEVSGNYYTQETTETSTGAADAGEIPSLNADGVLDPTIINAATSGAEVVVMTDVNGRIDESLMPVGIGNDAVELEASEGLTSNDVVNIHVVGGFFRVRRADASNGRLAHGFVRESALSGETILVYREGANEGVSGLTDSRVWLASVPGGVTSTPPTTSGHVQQDIGTAHSATAFYFQRGRATFLA